MSKNEIKFEEQELKDLQTLQQSYQEKQVQFGQLKVQILVLEQQKDALSETELRLEEEYKNIQQQERDLVTKLNEKYGPGTLDPTTGSFTPASPASPENKK